MILVTPKNTALAYSNPAPERKVVKRIKSAVVAGLTGLAFLSLTMPSVIYAAEGASSHYLPGAGGDIFLALPPEPGLQVADTLW
jgi:hypothetical protein